MPQSLSRCIIPLIICLLVTSCKTRTFLSKVDTERITVNKNTESDVDEAIIAMVEPYKSQLDAKMDRQIGILTTTLKKSKPEGTLNNWMTDIIHERAQHYYGQPIDFAIQNYGGIRVNTIPAGPLFVRKIYELMPFDNKIVILKLDGPLMVKMLDNIAKRDGMPISKGLQMKIDVDKHPQDVLINGEKLDINRTYVIALPDYVANGGAGCEFLQPLKQWETGWNVREAIIDYLDTYKEPMSSQLENRITKL